MIYCYNDNHTIFKDYKSFIKSENYDLYISVEISNIFIKFRNNIIPYNLNNLYLESCKFNKLILHNNSNFIKILSNYINLCFKFCKFNKLILSDDLIIFIYKCKTNYKLHFRYSNNKGNDISISKETLIYLPYNKKNNIYIYNENELNISDISFI